MRYLEMNDALLDEESAADRLAQEAAIIIVRWDFESYLMKCADRAARLVRARDDEDFTEPDEPDCVDHDAMGLYLTRMPPKRRLPH